MRGRESALLCIVDAFTGDPFRGNPAGVCVLDVMPPDIRWLQSVAAEVNHSETAFAAPSKGGWALRWFTPTTEVELCGHATLAAAHGLWEIERVNERDAIHFQSASGSLGATQGDHGVTLDFPALRSEQLREQDRLTRCLGGVSPNAVWQSPYAIIAVLSSPRLVRDVVPDLDSIRSLPTRSLIVTAHGDGRPYDFVSRVFAPAVGIDEDPVTGAAHCALGPLWSQLLGRSELAAYQASPRGGELRLAVHGERVQLTGGAVTVLKGRLQLPGGSE